jgi:hypothetical protein
VSEFLHLAALAPAGVAACCVVSGGRVDRRRDRFVEIAVTLLMLGAMIDVSRRTPLIAPVLWAALLLVGALVLGASTRRGIAGARGDAGARVLAHGPIHGALGCVVMAALVLVMVAPAGAGVRAVSHHGGGGTLLGAPASVLTVVVGAGVLAYGAYSVVALRHGRLRERIQFAAMGASTLGMAAAVFV